MQKTTKGLEGLGLSSVAVANSVLQKAFDSSVPVSPMKLQKLVFFVTALYGRRTGKRLIADQFQPWQYGPVCRPIYDEFRSFGGDPITRYAKDADGKSYIVDSEKVPEFQKSLDLVWSAFSDWSAVELSRLTHKQGSSWSKASEDHDYYIDEDSMASDHTFDSAMVNSDDR